MALTAIQWKNHLLAELATCIPDDDSCEECKLSLSTRVNFFWDAWEDMASTSLRLQYLYARRSAIEWLLGHLWPLTNGILGPLNARCKDRFDNLVKLREINEQAIMAEEKRSYADPFAVVSVGCT